MAKSNDKEEPSTAPPPDRWYNLALGPSFKDHHPSSKYCTLRYEFKPASIDKNQAGSLHKNKDNRVTVEFQNNQHGKPKLSFEGISEDYKENDAVLFFDGQTFRLERLHRAVKRLRHVRQPGESASAATSAPTPSVGAAVESYSPPVSKGAKVQSLNKGIVQQIPVEVEQIDIGSSQSLDVKTKNEKDGNYPPSHLNPSTSSPDSKDCELEEHLDIVNDNDDDCGVAGNENITERESNAGFDINVPHPADMDDEIAEVDVSDDVTDKGPNAAEALRAQVNAEAKQEQTSSASSSSGSDSSGSGSGSGSGSASGSGSGSGSSSSDSESSDGDSVHSI